MKFALAALTFTLTLAHAEKSQKPFWIDPAKATKEDPDFSIQGEYGKGSPGGQLGVQVVALGDGRFDAYILEDGLPGLGWERGKSRIKLNGSLIVVQGILQILKVVVCTCKIEMTLRA